MKGSRFGLILVSISLCWPTIFSPRTAIAHNKKVHDAMTMRAYQIMLKASRRNMFGPALVPPAGVSALQWKTFHNDITLALTKLDKLAGEPNPGSVSQPTGLTREKLALASSEPDYHTDDIHLFFKLTNAAGQSANTKLADEAIKAGAAAMLVPIVCAADCFAELFGLGSGTCEKCIEKAKDLAQDVPTPSDLVNLIPGFGDVSDNKYTGVWHFINMSKGAHVDNTYDDHQGLLYEKAGPFGVPGSLDMGIMTITDLVGLSVNPESSDGVKRYQIANANDSFPDGDEYSSTLFRSDAQWQKYAMGHTEFSPLDNFALWGWRGFRNNAPDVFPDVNPKLGRLSHLGYPLHALGDATVPMHVTGTTSWGHRPFEDAHERIWDDKISDALDDDAILAKAFKYRQEILAWRAAGHPNDIPVRHLVRAVAQHTFDYSFEKQQKEVTWPFDDAASLQYFIGEETKESLKEDAINIYAKRLNAVALVKPLIEDGIAAEIAFLVSATELNNIAQKTPAFPATDFTFSTASWPAAPTSLFVKGTDNSALKSDAASRQAHHAQPQAQETRAQAQFARAVKTNYALLARLFILDQLSPAEYLLRVWNQSKKAKAAMNDRALADEFARGDRDGDLVPDARDRCPETPPLVTTDAFGCPIRERMPNAPSRRDMQNFFRHFDILISPKCQSAPQPPTPQLLKIGTSTTVNRDLLFAVRPVGNQPANCLTFYQFAVRFTGVFEGNKNILPQEAYREVVFRNTDSKDLNPQQPPRLVFRIIRNPAPLSADHKFMLLAWGRYNNHEWRVRAINANGLTSEWSDWQKVGLISFGEP